MSKYLFMTKNVVTKSVPRKQKKIYKNDKGKRSNFMLKKLRITKLMIF